MEKARIYKPLSKQQQVIARRQTSQGFSQKDIARALGVAKQRVVEYQRILPQEYRARPQRREGATFFWQQVKFVKKQLLLSRKEAIAEVYKRPEWAVARAKRRGRKFMSVTKFWKGVQEERFTRAEFCDLYGEGGEYESEYPVVCGPEKGF